MIYLATVFIVLVLVGLAYRLGHALRLRTVISFFRNLRTLLTGLIAYVLLRLRDRILKYYNLESSCMKGFISETRFCFPRSRDVYCIRYRRQRVCEIDTVHFGDRDITEQFLQYLGPGYNFYGIPTSPGLLGYHMLDVRYMNGDVIAYDEDDTISVTSRMLSPESLEDLLD